MLLGVEQHLYRHQVTVSGVAVSFGRLLALFCPCLARLAHVFEDGGTLLKKAVRSFLFDNLDKIACLDTHFKVPSLIARVGDFCEGDLGKAEKHLQTRIVLHSNKMNYRLCLKTPAVLGAEVAGELVKSPTKLAIISTEFSMEEATVFIGATGAEEVLGNQ